MGHLSKRFRDSGFHGIAWKAFLAFFVFFLCPTAQPDVTIDECSDVVDDFDPGRRESSRIPIATSSSRICTRRATAAAAHARVRRREFWDCAVKARRDIQNKNSLLN